MQFQSHYNRFLLSLEGTKNIYVSFCENIISFCAPRTFRFADYNNSANEYLKTPDKRSNEAALAGSFFFLNSD